MQIQDPIELSRENMFVIYVVQAMIGAISPNMRAVSLQIVPAGAHLQFLLEHEDALDREEIEDILAEIEAHDTGEEVSASIIVSSAESALGELPGRLVFARREQ